MSVTTATPPSVLSLVALTLNFGAYGSAEQLVTVSAALAVLTVASLYESPDTVTLAGVDGQLSGIRRPLNVVSSSSTLIGSPI